MTRRRNPFPLADALGQFTDSVQPPTSLAAIQRAWPDAVGASIAKWASPIGEASGAVTVECDDSVVAHELQMMAPQLLEKLASELPENAPKTLRFVVR
ncbi:MAG: DUF721 domain-containing protein [Solirubrobacterales bacterium]